MSIGPIPWTAIMDYADRNHLPEKLREVFVRVIEEMDDGYLSWERDRLEREAKAKGGRK